MKFKSVSICVYGKVQGVYFRQSTKAKADELGLAGLVRNQPDGSVYIEAEGEAEKVDRLIQWCAKGPILARVERVQIEPSGRKNFMGFAIVR